MRFDVAEHWRQFVTWVLHLAAMWDWNAISAVSTALAAFVTAAATLIAFRALRANQVTVTYMRDQVELAREQTRLAAISTSTALQELQRSRRPKIIPLAEKHGDGMGIFLLNAGATPVLLGSVNIQYSNLNGDPLGDISKEDWSRWFDFEEVSPMVMPGEKRLAFLMNPVRDWNADRGKVLLLTQSFNHFTEPVEPYMISINVPVVTQNVRQWFLKEGFQLPGYPKQ